MKIGKKGLDLIKHFEGFKANAYVCPAGVLTIGYGTTRGVRRGQIVTKEEAVDLLMKDVAKFEKNVNTMVKVKLTQDQFDALVAFVYNIGPTNFKSSTLLRLLNQGEYDKVSEQMARWNKGDGKVLEGLVRRRSAEGVLFDTGKLSF